MKVINSFSYRNSSQFNLFEEVFIGLFLYIVYSVWFIKPKVNKYLLFFIIFCLIFFVVNSIRRLGEHSKYNMIFFQFFNLWISVFSLDEMMIYFLYWSGREAIYVYVYAYMRIRVIGKF